MARFAQGDVVSYKGPTADGAGAVDGRFDVLEVGVLVKLRDVRYGEHFREHPAELHTYHVNPEALDTYLIREAEGEV